MRSYTFYLYKEDGSLLGTAVLELESDDAAQTYVRDVFRAYPNCDELEVWETPRYVGQGRRRRSDSLDPPSRRKPLARATASGARS